MNEVTRVLSDLAQGDARAAADLLPLVYDHLRRLAAAQMAREKPGQTLDATALVHEAYLRLVQPRPASPEDATPPAATWANRRHFFAAAAEAMRRILVENARRKGRVRHGGGRRRVPLHEPAAAAGAAPDDLIAFDDALATLARDDPQVAEVVQLHVFTGLSIAEAGEVLGLSRATAYRHWSFARAWLRCELAGEDGPEPE
jgi:RNA polymerase sigma factor (TIGR02999 family)